MHYRKSHISTHIDTRIESINNLVVKMIESENIEMIIRYMYIYDLDHKDDEKIIRSEKRDRPYINRSG